tara:strand:+ start:12258 stop:12473 length:216 start_codon:yes stop_codon:yes gene_type:complete
MPDEPPLSHQTRKRIDASLEMIASIGSILAAFKDYPNAGNIEICPHALGFIGEEITRCACRVTEALDDVPE